MATSLLDGGEDLGLVADESVRHEGHDPLAFGIAGKVQGRLDALDHHGPATAAKAVQISQADLDVAPRRRERTRTETRSVARESDHLKAVVGFQSTQGSLDGGFGLVEGLASHAARAVEDEDHLDGATSTLFETGRRYHHQREIGPILVPVRQDGRLELASRNLVTKHEVTVRDAVVGRQPHSCPFR